MRNIYLCNNIITLFIISNEIIKLFMIYISHNICFIVYLSKYLYENVCSPECNPYH